MDTNDERAENECPTCGPTTAEPHPRRLGVARCGNCKEQLHSAEIDLAVDVNRHEVAVLRAAIEAAHDEQRQALDAGRGDETITLFQHWSATAGWLASRIRAIERVGEADWPDAMRLPPGKPSSGGLS